jgi:WD40 repeat protein
MSSLDRPLRSFTISTYVALDGIGLNPEVPRDLETVVLKAMAKEPRQRYASAAELAEDLRRFLEDRSVRARRALPWEQTWRWCRRNPLAASLLALVAGLAVAVAAVSLASAVTLDRALGETRAAERLARLREAEALVGQAHGTRLSRRPGQRFEALAALGRAADIGRDLGQPPDWFDRLRTEAVAALALPDVHITQEYPGAFPPGTVWLEWSDDLKCYARTTDQGGCTVYLAADNTEVARLPEMGEPAEVSFGPGRCLAVRGVRSRHFRLWDLAGREPARKLDADGVQSWRFRGDGRLLGLSHPDGALSVCDVATGACLHRLEAAELVKPALDLHPTKPLVAVFSYDARCRQVQVRDLRTGAVVASAVPPWPGGNGWGAWSPDGRTLTVPEGNGGKVQQYAFDPAAPALRATRLLDHPEHGGSMIAYNPAGDRFVSRGWDGVVRLFDSESGRLLFSTHGQPPASGYFPRFDPSGRRLAAARVGAREDGVGLWSVADGREYRPLMLAGTAVVSVNNAPAIHPDGRLAALGLSEGVALFDLVAGREVGRLPAGARRPITLYLPSPITVYVDGTGARPITVSFDGTDALLASGSNGFFRWPVRSDPANRHRLTVGPPGRLPFNRGDSPISASRDGGVIAQSMWNGYGMSPFAGGWILAPGAAAPRRVDAGHCVGPCSVSPNGRWVAFGTHQVRVNVHDAATGRLAWQSPAQQHCACLFSADGRWLVTDVDGGRLYAADTWEPGPQLGPGEPTDATADLAVLRQANGVYRLAELATGRELARLEDPEQNKGYAVFTPDGTKLIAAARDGLRVWDLRAIREDLARRGLDWDLPPYPPATEPEDTAPLGVAVDLGELGPK